MSSRIQRRLAIWKLSDSKVFTRNVGEQRAANYFVSFCYKEATDPEQCIKRLVKDPKEKSIKGSINWLKSVTIICRGEILSVTHVITDQTTKTKTSKYCIMHGGYYTSTLPNTTSSREESLNSNSRVNTVL